MSTLEKPGIAWADQQPVRQPVRRCGFRELRPPPGGLVRGDDRRPGGPDRGQYQAEAGRGGWRFGVPPPQGRGPESLLRGDRASRLLPLAGAGQARRHRLGRLVRRRAATRGLGLRGLAARVFGPPGEPPSEGLPARVGTLSVRVSSFTTVMSRTVPLRVEDRVDAFHHLEDL